MLLSHWCVLYVCMYVPSGTHNSVTRYSSRLQPHPLGYPNLYYGTTPPYLQPVAYTPTTLPLTLYNPVHLTIPLSYSHSSYRSLLSYPLISTIIHSLLYPLLSSLLSFPLSFYPSLRSSPSIHDLNTHLDYFLALSSASPVTWRLFPCLALDITAHSTSCVAFCCWRSFYERTQ